jgi:hypothetical protein
MILGNLSIEYSERLYNALLSLYPPEFRIRFAPEMLQLFRDCCREALEKGQVAVVVVFWLQVMRDLFVSVARERSRALLTTGGGPVHPLVGLVDLLLIPTLVTVKLLALGPALTLTFGGARFSPDQFALTSGFVSIAIGSLALATSLVLAKLRPTVRLWVRL